MVKKINKRVLQHVESGIKYEGCTFDLNFIEYVKGSTFSNCRFKSEGLCIERVENCRFMNCSFFELTIEELEKTTIKGGHIQCLRLSSLDTSDDEFDFIQTDNIKELHLDGCGIQHIPPGVLEIKNIFKLYLSENLIGNILGIESLENLVELYLDSNSIRKIPEKISELKKLTILVLSNNSIEELPSEMGELEKLTELYIEENKINDEKKEVIKSLLPNCDVKF